MKDKIDLLPAPQKYRGNHRFHCHICGCFVGKDGRIDVMYDGYNGGWEEGYHYCAKHWKEKQERIPSHAE